MQQPPDMDPSAWTGQDYVQDDVYSKYILTSSPKVLATLEVCGAYVADIFEDRPCHRLILIRFTRRL